jgi:hypothetical protein
MYIFFLFFHSLVLIWYGGLNFAQNCTVRVIGFEPALFLSAIQAISSKSIECRRSKVVLKVGKTVDKFLYFDIFLVFSSTYLLTAMFLHAWKNIRCM